MGKLTSYILGLIMVLSFSFYYLSSFYNPLIQWLGPVIGSPLIIMAGLLLFLVGDPVKDFYLIPIFIMTGLVIGIGSRKGTKAFFSTITIYGSILSLMGISLLYMLLDKMAIIKGLASASSSGGSLSNLGSTGTLPPVPPGSSISAILSEPLVGRVLSALSSLVGKGTSSSGKLSPPTSILSSLGSTIFQSFIIYGIVDFLIVAIIAALVGFGLNRVVKNGPVKKKKNPIHTEGVKMVAVIILCLFMIISFSVPFSAVGYHNASVPQIIPYNEGDHAKSFAQNFVSEAIKNGSNFVSTGGSKSFSFTGGFLGKSGSLYHIYAGYQENNSIPGGKLYVNSSIISAYFISYNTSNLLQQLGLDNIYSPVNLQKSQFQGLSNLIPEGIILYAFHGNSTAYKGQTLSAANKFVSSVNGSSLKNILSVSFNLSGMGVGDFTLYLYSFQPDYSLVENNLINNFPNLYNTGQSNIILKDNIANGSFRPISKGGSMNSFIMAGGYLNSSTLLRYAGNLGKFKSSINNTSSVVSFTLSMFEENNVYYSSGSVHTINLSDLIGYSHNLTFSGSTQSLVISGIPEKSVKTTTYTFNSYFNNGSFAGDMNFGTTTNKHMVTTTLNPAATTYTSNATFPAKLSINEIVKLQGNGYYKIIVGVKNIDTNQLTNVSINESAFRTYYPLSMSIISGQPFEKYSSPLNPGSSVYLNFTVKAANPGKYVMGSPRITYENNGTGEISMGTQIVLTGPNSSLVDTMNNMIHFYIEQEAASLIPEVKILSTPIVGYFYVFDLLILLLFVADIYIEISSYRRWKNQKS
ncbi:MAG: hypothetical protein ACYCSO_04935 [Cuniculiplasma sp.]